MKCPKCGSEMEYAIGKEGTIAEGIEEFYCRNCGHCEDISPDISHFVYESKCGYEEKVKVKL